MELLTFEHVYQGLALFGADQDPWADSASTKDASGSTKDAARVQSRGVRLPVVQQGGAEGGGKGRGGVGVDQGENKIGSPSTGGVPAKCKGTCMPAQFARTLGLATWTCKC